MNSWLRTVILYVLRFLEENLDTDLKARLEAYRKQRATLEADTRIILTEISQRETRLTQVKQERSSLEKIIEINLEQIETLKREVVQIDSEKHDSPSTGLSDSDVLRTEL